MSTFQCDVCGGETARNEFVSEVLEVDGRRVLVEHIPAQVCTRCSEPAFSRESTERIRLIVRGAGRPARTIHWTCSSLRRTILRIFGITASRGRSSTASSTTTSSTAWAATRRASG
ncbi:MAG: YgiT-type zinc finger protein [Pseudomonadota bacterium]|nr:YgiT-type zinc finger protein [Pseudomonadota bacterium]